jgi:MFS family permease
LVGAALLISACANTIQGPWQALVPDQVPQAQHGTAAGIKTLVDSIGVVGGLTIVGWSLSQGDLWTGPLTAVGLFWLILLATLLVLRTSPEPTRPTGSSQFQNPLSLLLLHLNHLPEAFPWWMVNRFLFWSSAIAIRTFMLNYMDDVLNIPLPQAQVLGSRLSLVIGAGVFLLVLPAGLLADRIGRRPLLMVAGLLAAAGAVLFVLVRDLPLLFFAGGLIAVGAGIFASASWALVTDIVPQSQGALYLGLANAASILGSAAGRLGGPVIDGLNQLTGERTVGYLVVFSLAALFFVGSSLAVLKIRER